MAAKKKRDPRVPKKLYYLLKASQAVSKKMTVRMSYNLFTSPQKFPYSTHTILSQYETEKKRISPPFTQQKIQFYFYGEAVKGTVLLIHGWSGRASQMDEIALKFVQEGYRVVTFDAPAHGNSTGYQTNLLEFIKLIKWTCEKYNVVYGIGHSMGGLSLLNATNEVPNLKKIVCIASPNKIENVFLSFTRAFVLKDAIAEDLATYLEKKFDVQLFRYNGAYCSERLNKPLLCIHDNKDKQVPISEMHEIVKANPNNTTEYISTGLGHNRILKDVDIVERIFNYIQPR